MKKFLLILSSVAVLVLSGCAKEQIAGKITAQSSEPVAANEAVIPADAVPGVLTIKLANIPDNLDAVKEMIPELQITSVRPTFPQDPRFAKRHHEAGLDLWYDIQFDERALMTKAAGIALSNENICHVDYMVPTVSNSVLPFNDPYLSYQWHYFNDGTQESQKIKFVQGADINLFNAWPIESGSENVIVAIIDSGIRYDHEDLADAMWINQAEYNGEVGVDDDGNGYVDDIYGYNFCTYDGSTMVGKIVPEDHGTHTAGTVGAVNNNGIGLCGIAGGNGAHKGVRLMSAQTNLNGSKGSYIGTAFVYAADNGAVICNNSWSFTDPTYRSASFEDALKYFVKYAGMDDYGNQVGPIAGGVVCFSAGNDASGDSHYPGNLDYVVCVAASAADNKLASYSNYGSWVNITAPGGDLNRMGNKGGVYSTTAGSTSSYESYQGTSMSCPHVTGVCALIASHFQAPGFTCDNVKEVLYASASDKIYDYNPGLRVSKGLGVGLVDAEAAVSTGSEPPAKIEKIETPQVKSNSVTITWTVPEAQGKVAFPNYVNIYLATAASSNYQLTKIRTTAESGTKQSYVFSDLKFETDYKFYLVAESSVGAKSEASEIIYFTTGKNNKPVITALSGTSLTLKACGEGSLTFKVTDADGHELKCSLEGDTDGASIKAGSSDDQKVVAFNAVKMDAGVHTLALVASDGYDETRQTITCTVKENQVPVAKKSLNDVVFSGSGKTVEYVFADLFEDPDGDPLTIEVSLEQTKNIIEASQTDAKVTITSKSNGYSAFIITASDPKGASVTLLAQVLVRDGSREIDLYPVPMSNVLNIRAAENKTGSIQIINPAGAKVIDQPIAFGPFNPQQLDVTGLSKGTYTVIISSGDSEYRQTVAKE